MNFISRYLKLILPSIAIWTIPFLVSFIFYDKTEHLVANFWLFKATMIFVLILTSYFALLNFYRKKEHKGFVLNSFIIIDIQIILDLIVLVFLLKMNIQNWFVSVLPIYVILLPIVNYWLEKNTKLKQS